MTLLLSVVVVLVPLSASAAFSDFDQAKWLLLGAFALITGAHGLFRPVDENEGDTGQRPWLLVGALLTLAALIGARSTPEGWLSSGHALAGWMAALAAFAVAARAAHRGQLLAVARAGAVVPPLLLGVQGLLEAGWFPFDVPFRAGDLTATIGNSGLLAECLVAHLGFSVLLLGRSRIDSAIALASLSTTIVGIAFADARAGVLALIAGFLVLAVTSWPKGRGLRPLGLGLIALIVLSGVAGALMLAGDFEPPALRERLATVVSSEHPTNRVRIELAADALAMWRDHPLAGVGPGRFGFHHPDYRSAAEWTLSGQTSSVRSPHCEPLRALAEGGILGGLALLIALFVVLRGLWTGLRHEDRNLARASRAALVSVAALAVFALVWFPFRQPATLLPLGVLLGLASGSRSHRGAQVAKLEVRSLALLEVAAGLLLLLFAEADAAAVAVRDDLEASKRELRRLANDVEKGGELAPRIAAAGAEAERCLRTAERSLISPSLRYRLLLAATDLNEEVPRIEAAARASDDPATATALRGATKAFPRDREVLDALNFASERAPRHLLLERLLARTELRLGRKPEAIQRLRVRLERNPETPMVRADLALIYRSDAEQARTNGDGGLAASLYDRVRGLLGEELRLYPRGSEADAHWEALIRITGRQGDLTGATTLVEEWIAARGESDLRRSLAGELALRFGETGDSLGRFRTLIAGREAPADERAEIREEIAGLDGLEPILAHRRLLGLLGRAPDDPDILGALEQVLGKLTAASRDPEVTGIYRRDRKRAIARAKVLYAAEQIESADTRLARLNLRLARRTWPAQGDAWLLGCLEQIRRDDTVGAIATIQAWRQAGFDDPEALAAFPELDPLLASPELSVWSSGGQ